MNARSILCAWLGVFTISISTPPAVAADPPATGVAGHYVVPGDTGMYFDFRADGTFSVTQGPHCITGTYTVKGNDVTMMGPGGQSEVFQIVNGVLIGPGGTKVPRTGEALSAAAANAAAAKAGAGGAVDRLALIKSMSNVKRLCTACALWAGNHQGRLPDSPARLLTVEYLGTDPSVLHCPVLHDDTQIGYEYYGKGLQATGRGDTIVFLSKWKDPAGKRIVGHLDDSVMVEVPKMENLSGAAPEPKPASSAPPASVPPASVATQPWHPWDKSPAPASHPGGQPFPVTFTNQQTRPVKLYWLSPAGERKFYVEIPPGEGRHQNVRKGAVWVVTDASDAPLGYFLIGESTAQAVVPPP